MTSTSAQDEFNELIRDKDRESAHPEDRDRDSDHSDPESAGADYYPEKQDTDDELDIPKDMRSNYYLPSIRSEANTGPKGVIADAHAFEQAREQAKKQARRFTWRKSTPPSSYTWHDEKGQSSEDEDSEGFLQRWREARLKELQNAGERIRSRTTSPSRRIYRNLPAVDGEGYLEAIEKSPRGTTVVVFIYDDLSDISIEVERCMREVAQRNELVRFVKLHYEDAEIEGAGVPAVLAYRDGESVAQLVPIIDELADDSDLSAVALETVFRQ
ncbi:thioredoxin-like protein [Aaosphaeria arxii CBS 175.79]|uniref:Thioredoxin-like protein n=1 Tax=Aaosphaeria arxii CBS 175.79 TaxID=1450172 RepID=A0A6A5XE80_9PLEO|nr:thioredoxin-like protein [Aaosphaeria arxii CBS 175.79]KAF2011348.1 thioredoxin-like protein [Aaosphaeria arxii CBS 175.79]